MAKKGLSLAVLLSFLVCTNFAFAAKRTDCPANNIIDLPDGKVCCCNTVPDEPPSYYECHATDKCDVMSGNVQFNGSICPCKFNKPN